MQKTSCSDEHIYFDEKKKKKMCYDLKKLDGKKLSKSCKIGSASADCKVS
jgi:hypothetical protein